MSGEKFMEEVNRLPLANAIDEIRSELIRAMKLGEGKELQFRIQPIELEMNIVASSEASATGGIKFWVLNFDGTANATNSTVHRLKVILEPVATDSSSDIRISEQGVPDPG